MKTLLGGLILSLGLGCGTSVAADLPLKSPPKPIDPPANWSGFYVGLQGGYAWAHAYQTNLTSGVSNGYFDQKGWLAGGTLGYNWQFGQWVTGLETDFAWSNLSGDEICGRTRTNTCTTELRAFGTLRGRIGWEFAPRWLVFAAGGLAYGDVWANRDAGSTASDDWRAGWTAGGGIETMFAPHWSAKLEYLYATFPGTATTYLITASNTQVSTVERDVQIVRGGINWHF
jgi:outer membrane immunogenic protein